MLPLMHLRDCAQPGYRISMIHTLRSPKSKKPKVQVGRGIGTGHGGHTAGRGTKGQKSRSGYSRPRPGFEGGQMPLARRLPKLRGFSRGWLMSSVKNFELPLTVVAEVVEAEKVDIESLITAGLIKPVSKKVSVKILFDGEINKPLHIEGLQVSAKVRAAVEKAGGSVA